MGITYSNPKVEIVDLGIATISTGTDTTSVTLSNPRKDTDVVLLTRLGKQDDFVWVDDTFDSTKFAINVTNLVGSDILIQWAILREV